MKWPSDIFNAFVNSIDLDPKDTISKEQFVQLLLDGTATRAIKIADGDCSKLECAYTSPYTPLGQMSADLPFELQLTLSINGHLWCAATDKLYEFVRGHAKEIIDAKSKD